MLALAAWIFAGIALWFTRSVLDVFDVADRTTRVAMLPSAPELVGLVALSLAVAAGVWTSVRRWSPSAADRKQAFRQISLPLFGLIVVVLPYLPWLPDRVAPLRAFAGPIVNLIWFVIAGQVVVTGFAMHAALRGRAGRLFNPVTIVLITAAVSAWAARRLDGTLTGIALIGMPAVSADAYHKVVWLFIGLTTVTAVLMWRWVLALTGSREAASIAWAAIFLGAPALFTGVSIYPEMPAAFCVMFALAWRSEPSRTSVTWVDYLLRGLAISVLPWLSIAYAPMAAALAVVLGLREVQNPRAVLALFVPLSVSLARWLGVHHAPRFGNPLAGVLGLLFDQEFGVLIYAPALALGLVGVWQMCMARDAMVRRRGRELALVFGVLLVSVGALAEWWGGPAPPGRPLVPALPLLGLPLAWAYLRAPEGSVRRSATQLLVLAGIAISFSMFLTEHGDLIVQDRDGSSRLLQWLTMLWPVWQAAPSIAAAGLRHAAGLIVLWTAVAVTVAWVCRSNPLDRPGASALAATMNVTAAVLIAVLIAPAVTRTEPASVTEPHARSRLPILDNFDSIARPHAIIYRPFAIVHAADIPPLMTLAAEPGRRDCGQPVPVFLNACYALAAGDYRVEIGGLNTRDPVRGTVGLQVGRIGLPLREWPVELPPGGTWNAEFSLPVDAEFVGFVTSASLSAAMALRITPLRIVDKHNRELSVDRPSRIVLSAVGFPSASIFLHDEDVDTERAGLWVRGYSTEYMTVSPNDPDKGVTLRVHSGAMPNIVTFETPTWGERVDLAPGTPRDVHLPAPARPGPFLLRVTTAKGFVPADVIPGSTDRRMLGCWIEIVPE